MLTINQVAKILNVTTRTVRRYINEYRILRAYRIGDKVVRIDEKDLEDFIHRHNNKGGE